MNEESKKRYESAVAKMDSKTLVEELEQRALMASYGYTDATTTQMLKVIKKELLERLKGSSSSEDTQTPEKKTAKPTALVFD